MICPKCLTVETEGSLRCRKCGAQLYTGVFQRPVEVSPEGRGEERSGWSTSRRAGAIAVGVFALSVVVLVVVLALLELHLQ